MGAFSHTEVVPLAVPAVVLVVAEYVLRRVPDIDPDSDEALLDSLQSTASFSQRYLGVYTCVGGPSWVIAAILAVLFGSISALLCAGVLDMHRHGMSPAIVGLAPVPAGVLQAITSHAGGSLSSSSRRSAQLLTASPLALAVCLVGVSLATYSTLSGPTTIVLPIVVSLCLATTATGIACVLAGVRFRSFLHAERRTGSPRRSSKEDSSGGSLLDESSFEVATSVAKQVCGPGHHGSHHVGAETLKFRFSASLRVTSDSAYIREAAPSFELDDLCC